MTSIIYDFRPIARLARLTEGRNQSVEPSGSPAVDDYVLVYDPVLDMTKRMKTWRLVSEVLPCDVSPYLALESDPA